MSSLASRPPLLLRIRWLLELTALKLLAAVLVTLPHPARLELGRALGRWFYRVDRRHAGVARGNLARAFPEADSAWLDATGRASFEHLGRLLVEVLLERRLAPTLRSRLTFEGQEHVQAAARAGGYFLLSGHFGNWEWIALEQGARGLPLWMVARPLDNPYLERWFASMRGATGNKVVYKRNAVREMVKGLKAGAGIAFMIDQHFNGDSAFVVDFFGRPAATTPALGTLAARLGAPIVPVFAFPEADGYRVIYEPAIVPEPGADVDAEALRLTRLVTARLEDAIRRCPSAWFWMHRRWRLAQPETARASASPTTS